MFSVLQRRPALFPLPRCAANEGTVTWRGRRVNILPVGIKGNQRQFQVSGFKFQVNGQGKTVSGFKACPPVPGSYARVA
jgi:hypothetical protein